MPVIDLRSDTVTQPSPEMRRAMAEAEVGDDVLGDDPTVNALEERAAELLGKEAAVFVTSGTQGNLVAQLAHLHAAWRRSPAPRRHIVVDEAGGHAALVRTTIRPIRERPDGTLPLDEIADAFREDDVHEPITGMVALENTHAMSMAQPLPVDYVPAVADLAHAHGVPLHIDGARFFNAVVALGVTARDLAGARGLRDVLPVEGPRLPHRFACVVGSKDFIFRARRARKQVGGGMRQVGVLAAAGLIALRDGPAGMIERLAEDHAHARRLAEAIAEMDGHRLARRHLAQPAPGPLDPERVTHELRALPRGARPGRVPRGTRGARRLDGRLSAQAGPRRAALRRDRGRHRHDHRGRRRRAARHTPPPAGPADELPTTTEPSGPTLARAGRPRPRVAVAH